MKLILLLLETFVKRREVEELLVQDVKKITLVRVGLYRELIGNLK